MRGYDDQRHTLRYADSRPIPSRDELMQELQAQVNANGSSTFNRALLLYLQDNPDVDLATSWDAVENYFAQKTKTRPRQNPYRR